MKGSDCRQSGQVRRADGAVDKPITSPQSTKYSAGWERIFGKSQDKSTRTQITK